MKQSEIVFLLILVACFGAMATVVYRTSKASYSDISTMHQPPPVIYYKNATITILSKPQIMQQVYKFRAKYNNSVFDARIEPSRLIMPLKTGNAYSVNFGHIPEMNYWTVTKIHGKVE